MLARYMARILRKLWITISNLSASQLQVQKMYNFWDFWSKTFIRPGWWILDTPQNMGYLWLNLNNGYCVRIYVMYKNVEQSFFPLRVANGNNIYAYFIYPIEFVKNFEWNIIKIETFKAKYRNTDKKVS